MLVWSEDKWLIHQLSQIKARYLQKLELVHLNSLNEIPNQSAFMAIINASKLTAEEIEEYVGRANSGTCENVKIFIRGYTTYTSLLSKSDLFIQGVDLHSALSLRKTVLTTYNQVNGKNLRKQEFTNMIRRLVLKINAWERYRDFTSIPAVGSKSTQIRDEQLIRRIEELQLNPQKCKRVERILAIYLHYDTCSEVPRQEFCDKFEINLRTLIRDLAELSLATGIIFYYDDCTGCYK
jgi:hypothetical protein